MKEIILKLFIALLFSTLLTAPIGAEQKPDTTKFVWRKLGPAMVEAQKTNKMILVDIYTDW